MYRRARLGIGYLPQEASIFRGLTVEQNIRSVLEVVEPDARRREAMLEALLGEFSITHLRRTPAWRCPAASGGASRSPGRWPRSRTSSCSTSRWPASIRSRSATSATWSSHLKDRGIGVLITDHNVRETLDLVDRAYIIHDGGVLMEGTPPRSSPTRTSGAFISGTGSASNGHFSPWRLAPRAWIYARANPWS